MWKALVIVVIGLMLMGLGAAVPAHASDVTDGRINGLPWVNSFGAVAVYCVDQFDKPGGSFTGGGIKILNQLGQKVFFAKEAIINPARVKANQENHPVFIFRQNVYILTALPGGWFLLTSKPDSEGKTFIGTWKDCIPVGPAPEAAPTAIPCTICCNTRTC